MNATIRLIDSHCHLDRFGPPEVIDEVMRRATQAGVVGFVVPAIAGGVTGVPRRGNIRLAWGVHPLEAHAWTVASLTRAFEQHPEPIHAIGECGLDRSIAVDRHQQMAIFKRQLQFAEAEHLPVIIHLQGLWECALDLLQTCAPSVPWILHGFAGSREMAARFCAANGYLGIDGTVLDERAVRRRQTASLGPLDRLLLETDTPRAQKSDRSRDEVLRADPEAIDSPAQIAGSEPPSQPLDRAAGFGGPQRNRTAVTCPADLPRIAAAVAELRGMPVDRLAEQLCRNVAAIWPDRSRCADGESADHRCQSTPASIQRRRPPTVVLAAINTRHSHRNLGIACLQAWWQRHSPAVPCLRLDLDGNRHPDDLYHTVLSTRPTVLALSCHIWNREPTLHLAAAVKGAIPECSIVIGGPEVSFDARDVLQRHAAIDAVIAGEGERPFAALLSRWLAGDRDLSGIPGVTWRDPSGALVTEPPAWLIESLDDLPSPFQSGLYGKGDGFTYYEASRGCPFRCQYCLSAVSGPLRELSLDRVRADLDWFATSGFTQVRFADRTFDLNPIRAAAIVEHILRLPKRDLGFHFELAADLLDERLIDLFAAAEPGRFHLEIGIQSMNPASLADVDRRSDLERVRERVSQLQRRTSCHLHLDLLLGLPAESREDFLRSLDATFALAPHTLQVGLVKVLPGTPLRQRAAATGIVHLPHPPYSTLVTAAMDADEIVTLHNAGRLIEALYNSRRFSGSLARLAAWGFAGSAAAMWEWLAGFWWQAGHPFFGLSPDGWARCLNAAIDAAPLSEAEMRMGIRELLAHERRLLGKVPAGPTTPPPALATLIDRDPRWRRGPGIRVFWADCDVVDLLTDSRAQARPAPTPLVYRHETDLAKPPSTALLPLPLDDRWTLALAEAGIEPRDGEPVAGRIWANAEFRARRQCLTADGLLLPPGGGNRRPAVVS